MFLAKFDAQEFYSFLSFRAKFETKMTMSLYCIDFGDWPEVKIVPNYRRVIIFCDKKNKKPAFQHPEMSFAGPVPYHGCPVTTLARAQSVLGRLGVFPRADPRPLCFWVWLTTSTPGD